MFIIFSTNNGAIQYAAVAETAAKAMELFLEDVANAHWKYKECYAEDNPDYILFDVADDFDLGAIDRDIPDIERIKKESRGEAVYFHSWYFD